MGEILKSLEEARTHLRRKVLRLDQAVRHLESLEVSEVAILPVEHPWRGSQTFHIFFLRVAIAEEVSTGWECNLAAMGSERVPGMAKIVCRVAIEKIVFLLL